MKKIIFALAAIALAATACNKAENIETPSYDYAKVPVKVSLSLPQSVDTKTYYDFTTPGNPVGGFNVTWAQYDRISICLWQTDEPNNTYNNTEQLVLNYPLPAEAEGLKSYDLSSVIGTIDLGSFDSSKNIKYVIAKGYVNPSFKGIGYNNGLSASEPSATMSAQIDRIGMIAVTEVQEVAFPTGSDPLELKGKLEWVTSAFAVQFDIADSAKDIVYKKYFIVQFEGPEFYSFVNVYYPSNRTTWDGFWYHGAMILYGASYGTSSFKLGDCLDDNNCRYGTIPADSMTDNPVQHLAGSKLQVQYTVDGGTETTVDVTGGTIGDSVTIEPGKVYGVKIKVTDSDSDGNPEFTKL